MRNIHDFSGRFGNEMFRDAFIYALHRRGHISDVYLQDYRYFHEFRDELRQRYGEGIGSKPFVGIHVRRGDYVNNKFYVNLADETDYYERAMELFPVNSQFLVFSDDSAYCQNRFKGDNIIISTGGTELSDFNELASCAEGIICANSSFSYWAAYLSNAKKIIFPKKYHPDGFDRTIPPPEWIRI